MSKIVALYARVSSEKQEQNNTISSQISELEKRIIEDQHEIIDQFKFIDNGYSGSNLNRPALERLRDKVSEGEIDKIYIHSPDRLSRKYVYQMILIEELQKHGVEIVFLNYQSDGSPESHLLLQVQGMIAEYEREKITERNRRGKIYAAKRGAISALACAPYGYRYIDKYSGNGEAFYEVNPQQAEVIQNIFCWIGHDRLSIREVCRRLEKMDIQSPKGKLQWSKSVIWEILKNPAYKGQAAFGRRKNIEKITYLKSKKDLIVQTKRNYSVERIAKENWVYISVPALVNEALFDSVQEQLEENRKMSAKIGRQGVKYLLQGLVVCKCCHHSYCGRKTQYRRGGNLRIYEYYRCSGSSTYHYRKSEVCNSKQIRKDKLEISVWEEVKNLLKNPERILIEYQRRISEKSEKSPLDETKSYLEGQESKLKRGISRLIDAYSQEYINKEEFESRIKEMKKRLKIIEEKNKKIEEHKNLENELSSIVANLEDFSRYIEQGLEEDLEWHTKLDIIRKLVKRIEIDHENVNLVFRIHDLSSKPTPPEIIGENHKIMQYRSERL